jgi:uncharacterized protein (TIGR02145 family)
MRNILVLIVLVSVILNGCKKDQNNSPINKTTAVFNPNLIYGTLTDQDGNVYKTIRIGTQTWMAENLRTTKYRNGDAIPQVSDYLAWTKLGSGAYCNYQNTNNLDSIATLGRLYNWYAISDSRNIAPLGWHMPKDTEWTSLINYLGGTSIAGGKLKETGTSHWMYPNTSATNESGFTAVSGGWRYFGDGVNIGIFCNAGADGFWWSNIDGNDSYNWGFSLGYNNLEAICKNGYDKVLGLSVRCVKD